MPEDPPQMVTVQTYTYMTFMQRSVKSQGLAITHLNMELGNTLYIFKYATSHTSIFNIQMA